MNRILAWFLFVFSCTIGLADESVSKSEFSTAVVPFLQKHCVSCHGNDEPEAGISLAKYNDSSHIQTDFEIWEKVTRALSERQMPPNSEPRPSDEKLQKVVRALSIELKAFDCQAGSRPGRVTIRRLNRIEYNNTIRDLVGIDFQPANDFPNDDVGEGFDNIGDVLSLSPLLLEKYFNAAGTIVEQSLASESSRSKILVVQSSDEISRREASEKNLALFASRAFRRPLKDGERDRLNALLHTLREQTDSDESAFPAALTAVLTSPHFLFRVEADPLDRGDEGFRPLNDYEIASRLSYFLWSSMPDEELFRLSEKRVLHKPEVLRGQVRRMLVNEKSRALTENFAGQWLQLRSLEEIEPDPDAFPDWTATLRSDMRRETELVFEDIFRSNRSLLEFLTADYTLLNERLAKHYGVEGVRGKAFRRVDLPVGRRGVLTHASILAITSNPTRTSPVKRGKWVLDNILGEPPPPPPDGVPELDENAVTLGTLRERMEQHRENPSCAVCHRKMDALGFGLENFNAIGQWRDRDGRFEINPAGDLPGGKAFDSAAELMQILAQEKRDEFVRCLTEKMLTYALGRGLKAYDRCTVNAIMKELNENEFRSASLIEAIVVSDPFLFREFLSE